MAHGFQGYLRLQLVDNGMLLVENQSTSYTTMISYNGFERVLHLSDDTLVKKIKDLLQRRYVVLLDTTTWTLYKPKPAAVPDPVITGLQDAEPEPDLEEQALRDALSNDLG